MRWSAPTAVVGSHSRVRIPHLRTKITRRRHLLEPPPRRSANSTSPQAFRRPMSSSRSTPQVSNASRASARRRCLTMCAPYARVRSESARSSGATSTTSTSLMKCTRISQLGSCPCSDSPRRARIAAVSVRFACPSISVHLYLYTVLFADLRGRVCVYLSIDGWSGLIP